ncbi:uncharacterized protein LOC113554608, partial [Rhopalosiphum maidis]|uniref:uncharacterized protein LOC113554608 n=1 Tax=Rhopalosiphum maidis TaxID=43146 RepID=UPI000EFE3508
MRHKKTEMVSNTNIVSTISQNKKKSNSKHNYLRNISNIFDTKDDTETNKVKCQELVEKTIETFNNEQNKSKEIPILKVHNQFISAKNKFETKKNKKTTNKMKTCTNAIQENLTKTAKKTNTEIKKEESIQLIEKKSYKLPNNNEGRLTKESAFVNVMELKNENSNETVLNKKKLNSKGPNGRPKCIVHAAYQKNINNDSSIPNCQHKRKLLRMKKMINNFHKRFK